jgi:hypothetical protein
MEGELTSVKISGDSRFALINHAPDVITSFLHQAPPLLLTVALRKYIYGTWRSSGLHESSPGSASVSTLSAVVLVASMEALSSVGVKVLIPPFRSAS